MRVLGLDALMRAALVALLAGAALSCTGSDGSPSAGPSCQPQCDNRCDGSSDGCGGLCEECPGASECSEGVCVGCNTADACGDGCMNCAAGDSDRWCVGGTTCGCELDSDCAASERCEKGSCQPCLEAQGCVRSELYPGDWTPRYTSVHGQFIHDFSYAGYHNSEDPIPTAIPGVVVNVLSKGADFTGQTDSTQAIQAAIDEVSEAGGGVVDFPAGEFRVDGHLSVVASGVVLKGESMDKSRIYFTATGEDVFNVGSIRFRGVISTSAETPLVADADFRDTVIEVADTSEFQVGDDVVVGWIVTQEWLVEHDMDIYWEHSLNLYKPFFRRQIVAIHPDGKVELDVPLRYPALMRDSAAMRKESGYLSEVGLEDLSLSNAAPDVATATAIDHTKLVHFWGVKDGWVQRVRSYQSPSAGGQCANAEDSDRSCHIQSVGLEIEQSKRFSVRDVTIERAQSREERGNGYLFLVRYSAEILIEGCTGAYGRHNFITSGDFSTTGTVFRNNHTSGNWCVNDAFEAPCFDEYHNRFAIANLVENHEATSGWMSGNRRDLSTGAGHVATESVFWRVYGGGQLYSFQYGHGYVIGADANVQTDPNNLVYFFTGHTGIGTEPEDWAEHTGERAKVHPASLFEDQLARRLRSKAQKALAP